MSIKDLLEKSSISRRGVLKGISATVAVAAAAGCSSDDDDDSLSYNDDLHYEAAERYAFNTGPFNCGAKCVHKFHVKNDRIITMTSAGDIPQVSLTEENTDNQDEWDGTLANKPMQYRSCVRGFSYIHRIYQPDRLKYPLKQMNKRGDIGGFQRISWPQAYEEIAAAFVDAYKKYDTLQYLPIVDRLGISNAFAADLDLTYLRSCSNASNGNSEAAKLDSVGGNAYRNSRSDHFNAGFIIYWGSDPSRHSNHENGSYWTATKAKEAGIPIVTICPVCTDNAAIYSNSVMARVPGVPELQTQDKLVKIPGWVPIRPGTDGALLAAMAYVLYRRQLFDSDYMSVENGKRKCFGFWKNDKVTSVAPDGAIGGYPSYHTQTGDFKGKRFSLDPTDNQIDTSRDSWQKDISFEEYLASLENAIDHTELPGWIPADADPAEFDITLQGIPNSVITGKKEIDGGFLGDPAAYKYVLKYASRLTGIKPDIIEALACHFYNNGTGKASKIDCGCGTQRQYAGAEAIWLTICFVAMAGVMEKPGGGAAIGMGSLPDNNVFATKANKTVRGTIVNNRPIEGQYGININDQNLAEIMLNGRDGRSIDQFKKDADWATHGRLKNLEGVTVDIYTSSASNRLITQSNINKTIEAFKSLKMAVVIDNVMTPTAAHADIVLPAATNWEGTGSVGGQGDIKIMKQNVIAPMYDSKRDAEITQNIRHYCAKALIDAGFALDISKYPLYTPPEDPDYMDSMKSTIENLATSELYEKAGNPAKDDFSWEEFKTKGCVQLNAPTLNPILGMVHHHTPGGNGNIPALENTTGYINFYSPFWGMVRNDHLAKCKDSGVLKQFSAGWRTPVARYIPVREGYEFFFEENNVWNKFTGHKSRRGGSYKLQFMTNKARNRAHTCQDNVAIIKDQFEQKVYMNPVDAAERGIKDGDMVYVYNDRGCTKIRAAVTYYIVPGVISVEHGAWYRASTDPTETVTVWYDTFDASDPDGIKITELKSDTVYVDVGGAENILTDDLYLYDPQYISQTASCHAGPCEVSLTKPQ